MSGTKFRVKLYGHTSDDVEAFCKKLAAVLMISETEAMILLHDVPLVVRDNLTEPVAQNLSELLISIRALSIAEPMDGVVVKAEPPVPESIAPGIPRTYGRPDGREDMRSRIWMYLGLGLSGLLVLSVIVGVTVSYVNLYRGPAAATQSASHEEDAAAAKAGQVDEDTIADVQWRVDTLKQEYAELRKERDAAHKDMSVADYRLDVPGEMEIRRARLRSAQEKMEKVLKDLVQARLQLDRMKKRSGRKTGE